jgi:predicted RNA-binding protein with PUA-like domain
MATWLLKTEPGEYGWSDLLRERRTVWSGVRNAVALRHLAAMRAGDLAIVYHTGGEKQAVGVATIASEPYPDPAARGEDRALVVDVAPRAALVRPVTLAALRAEPAFAASPLVRQPRLSVVPLDDAQWARLLALAGGTAAASDGS